MFKEYTLVYPTDDNGRKILLGMQGLGLWHSFYNGFGGKVEPKETPGPMCYTRVKRRT